MDEQKSPDQETKERIIKQLNSVVCICKGIKLAKFIPALKECHSVKEVNDKVGSGSGGCKGERCGPRIKKLLDKKKASS